ncbi:MAG: hypothetical protein MUQ65_06190, partial [Armatimonadetes bacterium]|nr:hypothetical protein [Armatimonadota bacterium]
MSWDSFRKKALSRRAMGALSLAGALALVLGWQRPWADSVMKATVTLSTDGAGVVAQRDVRALFSERGGRRPVCEVELDLGRWEGELVRVDVGGKVSRRELPEGETGYVACAAELVDGEGGRPLDFAGWQQGPATGLHIAPLGPQSFEVEGVPGFVFAMKGALWHVVRARRDQRVRLRLRAVPTADLEARPKPFVLVGGGDEDPGMRWPVRKPDRPPDVFIYLID